MMAGCLIKIVHEGDEFYVLTYADKVILTSGYPMDIQDINTEIYFLIEELELGYAGNTKDVLYQLLKYYEQILI